jgi:hypothetical protein
MIKEDSRSRLRTLPFRIGGVDGVFEAGGTKAGFVPTRHGEVGLLHTPAILARIANKSGTAAATMHFHLHIIA